jgi:hypothetical protein
MTGSTDWAPYHLPGIEPSAAPPSWAYLAVVALKAASRVEPVLTAGRLAGQ